jgi:hypothetical protein
MSEPQNEKNLQQSGSENITNSNQSQAHLGLVPYFTDSIEISAYEGCIIAASPVKMAGNHEPPIRRGEDITGMSKNSRLRLIKRLACIHWKSYRSALFSTLTYHNEYPQTGKEVKIELDKFIKRIERSFPSLDYVWRMELQKRGAPHFHFIFFIRNEEYPLNPEWIKRDVREHWLAINPCGCESCVAHAVETETLENFGKVIAYVSKYVAKETKGTENNYTGRRWGYIRTLSYKEYEKIKLSGLQFIYLKLLLLQSYEHNDRRRAYIAEHLKNIYSVFILADSDIVRSALVAVLTKSHKDIYDELRKQNALPFAFDFPPSDSKCDHQLRLCRQ